MWGQSPQACLRPHVPVCQCLPESKELEPNAAPNVLDPLLATHWKTRMPWLGRQDVKPVLQPDHG